MVRHQRVLTLRRNAPGVTLIETVMGLAILSVIMIIAAQLSMTMSQVTAEENSETQVQTDLRRALSELVFTLQESRPIAMWQEAQLATKLPHLPKAPDGTYNYNMNEDLLDRGMTFTFAVPIKTLTGQLDRKGTTILNRTDLGKAYYGAGDGGAGLGAEYIASDPVKKFNTYTLFFLPNGQILDEAVENIDVDENGSKTDKFIYGGLYISNDATKDIRLITGRIAIKQFIGLPGLYPADPPGVTTNALARDADRRGKCFYLEGEAIKDNNQNGIYDTEQTGEEFSDDNKNLIWDVKMTIRFYFPILRNDPRRGKISKLRVIDTRINYFRNSYPFVHNN